MSALRWLERWALRRAGKREGDTLLQLIKARSEIIDGKHDHEVVFEGAAAKVFAAMAIRWFQKTGGPNFVTCEITCSDTGESYELTMRSRHGKSTSQVLGELRARIAELERAS